MSGGADCSDLRSIAAIGCVGRAAERRLYSVNRQSQASLAAKGKSKVKLSRAAYGRLTERHQGGGHKRAYRVIDFRRHDKDGVPAKVARIEYDPNRGARIALLHYADGEKRYILAPNKLSQGDVVEAGAAADIRPGNNLPLRSIPTGTVIHAIELKPGGGAKIARSSGASVQLVAKVGPYAQLRMPSGEIRNVDLRCRATIGEVGNAEQPNPSWGKVGRRKGKSSTAREVVLSSEGQPQSAGGSRRSQRPNTGVSGRLQEAAATRYIALLAERRAISAAHKEGLPQTAIARMLGVSQPTVHRQLRQFGAAGSEPEQRTIREIIAEAVSGITDRDSMMSELRQRNPQPGVHGPDGYTMGEWDEVVDAWEAGWLTDGEYEQLARF
ncbi:MAG: 50S ribosomal protein L2 [Actinobacteria bacterium]|nr:50S ribosomal protein L2 [Actinomycetota bacterium]